MMKPFRFLKLFVKSLELFVPKFYWISKKKNKQKNSETKNRAWQKHHAKANINPHKIKVTLIYRETKYNNTISEAMSIRFSSFIIPTINLKIDNNDQQ